MNDNLKTMLLVTIPWTQTEKTFRLIPISNTCPYIDCIYTPDRAALQIIGAFKKKDYALFPKINDNGDIEKPKSPRAVGQGQTPKNYKEERKIVETCQDYYILEKKEIEGFIKMVAVNSDSFDYKQYMQVPIIQELDKPKVELLSDKQ